MLFSSVSNTSSSCLILKPKLDRVVDTTVGDMAVATEVVTEVR